MDSLSRIRSGLGIPLYANECTTKVERISYARILIEMDVTRELPVRIKVLDPNRRIFEQEMEYDWVPAYCPQCLQVGHICKAMQKQPPAIAPKTKITNPKQAWIKKPEKTADTQVGATR